MFALGPLFVHELKYGVVRVGVLVARTNWEYPDERIMKLSADYEQERTTLEARVIELQMARATRPFSTSKPIGRYRHIR